MNAGVDRERLAATLGRPELARVVARMRRRLELGRSLTGPMSLNDATPEERAGADALFGRRPTRGAALSIDLDQLATHLRAAGICDELPAAVVALTGPVVNRAAAASAHESAWNTAWRDGAHVFASQPNLRSWIEDLRQSGILKRLCRDDPKQAGRVLLDVARVADALPAQAEPLASFAARLFGDAHALDPGTPRATLAVRAAARIGEVNFQDNAEGRRAAWAGVGVMCDELSTPALVLNLPAQSDTPLARMLRAARADGEPLHLSLRILLRHPLDADHALAGVDIFACENPTIVALAAAKLGRRCAPLICVNGQFATPALVLMRQLRIAGANLYYHGDFDPAGLAIAARVIAESGARPWRYDARHYDEAPKGPVFEGAPGPTAWDTALSDTMSETRRVVHEEAVYETLAQDLAKNLAGSSPSFR